ncbi:hypothetical protein [[Clostridium] polysaccharolyticum]|uniref:KAP family P-loop domain-containing protein n=1 Tax=[Clostridium] polysaccharolyticum TaxID=29364 RepID=A0A1I0FAE1_9FIRM|nr:hypothetical protein [[Clostridium] polysaccharolyticum]SET54790.1 hypothetical protein SAMN04487772_1296 [[Clostridium] polysaccharolyticum]
MINKIKPNDCEKLFENNFNLLNRKEIGIELKHFSIGTPPESPSFLVNQDNLKKVLIDKFKAFFDNENSKGMEMVFLKSNYGNGKSHFFRRISSFFNQYENVTVKNVSMPQVKIDLHQKILEGISQKFIKNCSESLINELGGHNISQNRDQIIQDLIEKYSINIDLASLIYEIASEKDTSKCIQAISILKGTYLDEYLGNFKIKKSTLTSNFYFEELALFSKYLVKTNSYIIILFDEYEHIHTWSNSRARALFYSNLKALTDELIKYSNFFFLFAESVASDNTEPEGKIDPAFVSRKRNITYQIEDISSEQEVVNLLDMIKIRYEKYYEIDYSKFYQTILEKVCNSSKVGTNSNYRSYISEIVKVLDEYRQNDSIKNESNNFSQRIITSESSSSEYEQMSLNSSDYLENSYSKTEEQFSYGGNHVDKKESSSNSSLMGAQWKTASSKTRKTILCNIMLDLIAQSADTLKEKHIKQGYIFTNNTQESTLYKICVTKNPSNADFSKCVNEAAIENRRYGANKVVIMYPYIQDINKEDLPKNEFSQELVILYNIDEVPNNLNKLYSKDFKETDVLQCLSFFDVRN